MPCVLDDEAHVRPEKVFAVISISGNLADGFQNILFAEMANAVNFVAKKLQKAFKNKIEFETMTFVGLPDLRYNIVFYAAIKCGYKVPQVLCHTCFV